MSKLTFTVNTINKNVQHIDGTQGKEGTNCLTTSMFFLTSDDSPCCCFIFFTCVLESYKTRNMLQILHEIYMRKI